MRGLALIVAPAEDPLTRRGTWFCALFPTVSAAPTSPQGERRILAFLLNVRCHPRQPDSREPGPRCPARLARVPVPTFAALSCTVESKCRNHEEHEQAYGCRVVFASDVWLRATPRVGPKRQMRYTSTHAITNSARRVSNNKTVVGAVEALSSASDLPSDVSHGLERAPLPHAAEQEACGGCKYDGQKVDTSEGHWRPLRMG